MPRYKKAENKQRIIEAFANLALKRSFQDISLKEVSTLAGISITSFYSYFDSKDDLLKYYVDYSLDLLEKIITSLSKSRIGIANKIRALIYIFSTLLNDERLIAFHRVFREFEFLKEDLARYYYNKLFDILNSLLKEDKDLIDTIDLDTISLAIIGSAEFIYLFRKIFEVSGNISIDIEVAGDLILKGLGGSSIPEITQIKVSKDLMSIIEETNIRNILNISDAKWSVITAALKVVSSKSFRDAKIYEIMEKANYSIGMFYKFYEGKRELLKDLVNLIGKTLRRYLTICSSNSRDPIEREIMGTACFLGFVENNGSIYRIVRESEYIDIEIAKMYYVPFSEAYANRITQEIKSGSLISYDPKSLVISLMGINHMAGVFNMILKRTSTTKIVNDLAHIYSIGLLRGSK